MEEDGPHTNPSSLLVILFFWCLVYTKDKTQVCFSLLFLRITAHFMLNGPSSDPASLDYKSLLFHFPLSSVLLERVECLGLNFHRPTPPFFKAGFAFWTKALSAGSTGKYYIFIQHEEQEEKRREGGREGELHAFPQENKTAPWWFEFPHTCTFSGAFCFLLMDSGCEHLCLHLVFLSVSIGGEKKTCRHCDVIANKELKGALRIPCASGLI